VFNIASGQPITIRQVIEKVVSMVGGGKPDFGTIPYRAGENMALYADINLAEKMLGWHPVTAFDEGLRTTIAYYRKAGRLEGRT
jgi:nucleoside-diphosphate-sugar epimerase